MTLTTSIMVRDHNNPTVVATTGTFTVAPAPAETMTVRTPVSAVVGIQVILAGTYANGTPAAIDYSTDAGATWFPLGSPSISGGSWTGTGPTYSAANAAATIMVRDHGNTGVTATTAQFSVAAAPSNSTLFKQQFTFKNPEDQTAQISPFFSLGMAFAPSDLPATGTKMVIADATGTNIIGEVQVDQKANGWTDGSTNMAALTGVLTGSTLNPGDIAGPITIMAVPGTPNTTPCSTLAQFAASSNIKIVCKIGADTYTISLNNIIAKYNYGTTRPSYPVGFIENWKSGPQICEDMLAQYLIRDSDGAQHRWVQIKSYISRLANGGAYIVLLVENSNTYGPHPSGTIGSTTTAGTVVIDSIDIFNGTTRVASGGGINDKRATTFPFTAVNVATASIACAYAGVTQAQAANTAGPFYTAAGFSSTGKLPGSMTASDTYWVSLQGGQIVPFISRNWLARINRNVSRYAPVYGAGLSVTVFNYVFSNGSYYLCTKAGVTAGVMPSGATSTDGTVTWTQQAAQPTLSQYIPIFCAGMRFPSTAYYTICNGSYFHLTKAGVSDGVPPSGASYTDANGTAWLRVSAPMSDQGSGTHTIYPKVAVNQYSKAAILDMDTYPFWIGSGTMPKLLPGYPIKYLTQKTRAIPPLPLNLTLGAWQGAIPVYFWNTSYLPGQPNYYYIGDTAQGICDERINSFGPNAAANILMPNDVGMARSMRYIGLSYMDRIYYPRDERAQQQVIANYGPDKVGGTYPGMAPSNPTLSQTPNTGSPKLVPVAADTMNWPGYGGDLGSTQPWESTHSPNPLYWPYVHSGHPVFLDAMMEYCNSQFISVGGPGGQGIRTVNLGGKNYSFAFSCGVQARGYGHQLKTMWQTEWSIPSNHQAKPYFSDRMDDTSNQFMNWIAATFSPTAQANGWVPTVYNSKPWPQAAIEPWMQGFFIQHLGQIAWIGTRPGFANILAYALRSWIKLYDSDKGGTEKMMDIQWYWVSTDLYGASLTTVPTDANFISDGHLALSDPYGGPFLTEWPPAQNNFVHGLTPIVGGKYNYRNTVDLMKPYIYVAINRSALVLGAVSGNPDCAKVLTRVDALLNLSGIPIQYVQPTTQVSVGNRNGLQFAADPF